MSTAAPLQNTAAKSPPVSKSSHAGLLLQRKCACGESAVSSLTGECDACKNKRLQTKLSIGASNDPLEQEADRVADQVLAAPAHSAVSDATPSIQRFTGQSTGDQGTAPPSVDHVLASSGRPLGAALLQDMGQRFGHDFSRVQVHTGAAAEQSARDVNAHAYTVGNNVVFGAGRFVPGSHEGRRLLAHELAHVVQQSWMGENYVDRSNERRDLPPRIKPAIEQSKISLQRVGFGELRVAEGLSDERVREEAIRASSTGPMNMAGRILTDPDVTNATRAAPGAASPSRITPGIRNGRFVLHDTAASVGATRISEHQQQGRRSSGEGAGAWVPRATPAVIAHQPFFGPRRPAATQFERGQDIMIKATRESEYRAIWNATNQTQREAALDAVLAAQGSPPLEATAERATALREFAANAGDVHSAGAWAIEDICSIVFNQGATAVAASPTLVPNLEGTCQRLAPLFNTRAARIGSTVNVEIVQDRGSDCRVTGALTALSPYTDSQYTNVTQLYLRAALEARFFPEITTHFQLDKGVGDHCDPRCFRLNQIYEAIQAAMGHHLGCAYGITPNYGTGAAHNVWWHDTVHGKFVLLHSSACGRGAGGEGVHWNMRFLQGFFHSLTLTHKRAKG